VDLQLDTPQITSATDETVLESNLDTSLTPLQIITQPFERFFDQVKNYPVLKWEKVQAAERYIIEIARDPDFTKLVVKAPTWDPFYVWETARPGNYYYRVQAFNERYTNSAHSRVRHLRVEVDAPTPTSQDEFVEAFSEPKELWPPPRPFTLSWTPVAFARGYDIQFCEDQTFQDAKIITARINSKELRVSKSGLYYWRVRAINEKGVAIGMFSPIRSVEVIQSNRAPAGGNSLAGVFPLNRTMLFVGRGLMNLAFHWLSPVDSASTTTIEVSTKEDFSSLLASASGRGGKLVLSQDLPEGKIFWRAKNGKSVSEVYQFDLRREREPYMLKPLVAPIDPLEHRLTKDGP